MSRWKIGLLRAHYQLLATPSRLAFDDLNRSADGFLISSALLRGHDLDVPSDQVRFLPVCLAARWFVAGTIDPVPKEPVRLQTALNAGVSEAVIDATAAQLQAMYDWQDVLMTPDAVHPRSARHAIDADRRTRILADPVAFREQAHLLPVNPEAWSRVSGPLFAAAGIAA